MAGLEHIGNYLILEKIASGSFGDVSKGRHVHLATRIVAIKQLKKVHFASEKERESFFQEAEMLEKLRHPHILPLYDIGLHQEVPYLVTQYAPGGSLRDRLRKQQQNQLLPLQDCLTLLQQIASALHHAHQNNVVHRDLKPENILFDEKGNALLADFGISTTLNTSSLLQATITGTPPYMAPEQFRGQVSRESDQYALGCLAFELFTGHKPFTASEFWSMRNQHIQETPPSLKGLNPSLPDEVEQSVLTALKKERKERHSDVMAFVGALHRPFIIETVLPERKTAEQWFEEGKAFFDNKEYEQALSCYQRALELNPNSALYHNNLGTTLYRLNRYEDALPSYQRALELNPNSALYHHNLGSTFYMLKRYEQALPCRQRAVELDPTNAVYQNNLGNTFYHLNRHEEALPCFQRAVELDPTNAVYHNTLGITFYHLKRYEEALPCYDQAIQLDSSNSTYKENKKLLLNMLNGQKVIETISSWFKPFN